MIIRLWLLGALFLSACSGTASVSDVTSSNTTTESKIKTDKEVSLRRDIFSGEELARIPANTALVIERCTQVTKPIQALYYWVRHQDKSGYVNARLVQLVGNAPTPCAEIQLLDDKIRELEYPLIAEVAKTRVNTQKVFVDDYLPFVLNGYKQVGLPIVAEMKWYDGEVAGNYNVFFKTLNCHATKEMKTLHLWIQPMNARNRPIGTPTEFNIGGPLAPNCDYAEAKFMAVKLGRGVTQLKITKAQVDYTDRSRATTLTGERAIAPILGCSLQNGGCLTKFDALNK